MQRWKMVIVAPLVAGSMLAVGSLLPARRTEATTALPVTVTIADALAPTSPSPDALIDRLEGSSATAASPALLADLGLAYLQKVKNAGDPDYLSRAGDAFRSALELDPDNFKALVGSGVLAGSRHRFDDMVALGKRAIDVNPFSAAGYGVVADGLIELAEYRQAARYLQEMIDRRPGLAASARVSYLYEHLGNTAAATRWMRRALRSAGSAGDIAFASYHLGLLQLRSGDEGAAERSFRRGAQLSPDGHLPLAGLAHLGFARGNIEEAIRLLERAVAIFPSVNYYIALGDLHEASGRPQRAASYYEHALELEEAYLDNGANADPDLAVFMTDIGLNDRGLAVARDLYRQRRTGGTEEALGWALLNAGRPVKALRLLQASIAHRGDSHTRFFAAQAALASGRDGLARRYLAEALAADPTFSYLYARRAAEQLDALRAAR